MSDAPKRIWAIDERGFGWRSGSWVASDCSDSDIGHEEYIRADLIDVALLERVAAELDRRINPTGGLLMSEREAMLVSGIRAMIARLK